MMDRHTYKLFHQNDLYQDKHKYFCFICYIMYLFLQLDLVVHYFRCDQEVQLVQTLQEVLSLHVHPMAQDGLQHQ